MSNFGTFVKEKNSRLEEILKQKRKKLFQKEM